MTAQKNIGWHRTVRMIVPDATVQFYSTCSVIADMDHVHENIAKF